jgi:hypothetical protein
MSSGTKLNGSPITDLNIGVGKEYVFQFSDQGLFNSFNFLNYGSHVVTKGSLKITLLATSSGPQTFTFESDYNSGNVTVSADCAKCSGSSTYVREYLRSNDSITASNAYLYLKSCSYLVSASIVGPVISNLGQVESSESCGSSTYNIYAIDYCCTPVPSTTIPTPTKTSIPPYYAIEWTADVSCVLGVESYFNISGPSPWKIPSDPFDAGGCQKWNDLPSGCEEWVYQGNNKINFVRAHLTCVNGVGNSQVLPDSYFVDPSLPSSDKGFLGSSCAPTPTPTPAFNYHTILEVASSPRQLGNHFFIGSSEKVSSPNSSDLTNRAFYKLTDKGYLMERNLTVKEGSQNVSGKLVSYTSYVQGDDKNVYDYAEVVDYSKPVPVSTPTPTNSLLIKDVSLVSKIYEVKVKNTSAGFNNENAAEINWQYWFNDLPKAVYGGSANWWSGVPDSGLPKLTVIDYGQRLKVRFPSGSSSVSFSQSNNVVENSKFEVLKISSIIAPDSTSIYKDAVFNVSYDFSSMYPFGIKYSFSPTQSMISSAYSSVTTPIVREERITIIEPHPTTVDTSLFKKSYGVDKTLGHGNPTDYLIEGFFNKIF